MKVSGFLMMLVAPYFLMAQGKVYNPVLFPADYTSKIDVVYKDIKGWQGRMDLYVNPNSLDPTPIVLNIHGGGWNHGEKESQTGFGSFFKNGFAVANVEYRLVDVAPAPAAIQDVRCALIYLIQNADRLNIDPSKIVIMGGSSGGHLALMAGLLGNNHLFDKDCPYDGEIEIAAIYNKYGPTDLTLLRDWGSAKRWLASSNDSNKFVKSVSPIYHIDTYSPPVFIVHGLNDPIVPYEQSELLKAKLDEFQVPNELVTVAGEHGKFTTEQNRMINDKFWKFLEQLGLTKLKN